MEINTEKIRSIEKSHGFFEITYENDLGARLYLYDEDIIRFYLDPKGDFSEEVKVNDPKRPAQIVVGDAYKGGATSDIFLDAKLEEDGEDFIIDTKTLRIRIGKEGDSQVFDKRSQKLVFNIVGSDGLTLKFSHREDEFFYGGGVQNGRFAHKNQEIEIKNTNNWLDGGVASPNPFFFSSAGYGLLANTFAPGKYVFKDPVEISHEDDKIDLYFMVNFDYYKLIDDYYKITGRPVILAKFAFYPAHLNAYNRDYWIKTDKEDEGSVLFEDGDNYKEYQPGKVPEGKEAILESLNGEKDNYQFSARSVIDNYKKYDMPLGWFLPNDGYGAGYGQSDSLEGDIENLKDFTSYARANNIEVGLWTEEDLHPQDKNNPQKGERDIEKEIVDAGVRALKTDVAWVGDGYSFGLNGVTDAGYLMRKLSGLRPTIISLDGWAGTQREAGVWSGDQTGGKWEYIRFHIPTYIGAGLSGMPNIGSDLDGIFGGLNKEINVRDFEWKSFTPIELNMDGWSPLPKNPYQYDEEARAIKRSYLKLKSQMLPYNYSYAYKASFFGAPMIRAMFLDNREDINTYGNICKYQYMWGDYLLVAPVYEDSTNSNGDRVRNGIYLPEGDIYYDFFTGRSYRGEVVLNNYDTPLWKIPVFVKEGAIIPMVNPNNNPYEVDQSKINLVYYPSKNESTFLLYDDDGISEDYLKGDRVKTPIKAKVDDKNNLSFTIGKTEGNYKGYLSKKSYTLNIFTKARVNGLKILVDNEKISLDEVKSYEDFLASKTSYFYNHSFHYNSYMDEVAGDKLDQDFLQIKLPAINTLESEITIEIEGLEISDGLVERTLDKNLATITKEEIKIEDLKEDSFTISLDSPYDSYEILFDSILYTDIERSFTFKELEADRDYELRVRGVRGETYSEFSEPIQVRTLKDIFNRSLEIKNIRSNYAFEENEPVDNIYNRNLDEGFKTKDLGDKKLELVIEFDDIKNISEMIYYPRDDFKGSPKRISIFTSLDGRDYQLYKDKAYMLNDSHYPDKNPKKVDLEGVRTRFIKLVFDEMVDNYLAGSELVFVEEKQKLDLNKTFFENYAGLEATDTDYKGYVEGADLDKNGLIDAYDIYNSLYKESLPEENPNGSIEIRKEGSASNKTYQISAKNLKDIGAFSLKVSYNNKNINKDDIKIKLADRLNTTDTINFSRWRRHTNGEENFYLIFINKDLEGSCDLVELETLDEEIRFTEIRLISKNGLEVK